VTDTERHSGVCKWFTGNFGFIQTEDGQPDMYVHITALQRSGLRTLNEGDRVEYSIEADKFHGRPKAVALKLI
jgi:cold shock protein